MLTACLAFATAAALVTITPGLDTMLVLRATVTGGRREWWAPPGRPAAPWPARPSSAASSR
ncbi:hypothetical protein [Actinomadura sp. B10D3]|uniref:hypothetical protein n=1 Tax=Actinomadura sp. B10D3 TaxID=3153557 RepID=UPI00325DFC85